MDACRDFGCTPDFWEDALDLDRLAAMHRSRQKRPPIDIFAAAYFQYEPPNTGEAPELPEEETPIFMP